jgi:hypothetical protein
MRYFCSVLCLALPTLASADACRDEIAALFAGPLDPFQRPAHRQITTVYDPTGTEIRQMLSLVETPLRTIAGQPSQNWFTMAIDQNVWNGPSPDGPWTNAGAQMPSDRADAMKQVLEDQIANLSDTSCHGSDASGLIRYTYRTVTNPDASGSYFGSLDRVTLDPNIGQIVEFDRTEFINPWTEGISMERWLIKVEFDPSIAVNPPE